MLLEIGDCYLWQIQFVAAEISRVNVALTKKKKKEKRKVENVEIKYGRSAITEFGQRPNLFCGFRVHP